MPDDNPILFMMHEEGEALTRTPSVEHSVDSHAPEQQVMQTVERSVNSHAPDPLPPWPFHMPILQSQPQLSRDLRPHPVEHTTLFMINAVLVPKAAAPPPPPLEEPGAFPIMPQVPKAAPKAQLRGAIVQIVTPPLLAGAYGRMPETLSQANSDPYSIHQQRSQ